MRVDPTRTAEGGAADVRCAAPLPLLALRDLYVLAVVASLGTAGLLRSPRLKNLVVRCVAATAFRFSHAKRRGSEETLARVFGRRVGARRRRAIVRGAFYEFWRDTFSLVPLRGERPAGGARVQGLAHLSRALDGGRGAILWVSNNFGRMNALKRTLHEHGLPVHKVHAENHLGGFRGAGHPVTKLQDRHLGPFFEAHEKAFVAGMVYLTPASLAFTRELVDRLEANAIVCVAADARFGRRFVPLPFLGIPESFPTGVVTLARMSGAPILPAFCIRGPRGESRVIIEAPLAVDAHADRERGAEDVLGRWVRLLEHHARRHPSLYLNWHLIGTPTPERRHGTGRAGPW